MALTGRESDKFMLRLPEGLRTALKAAAAKNGRSMNAEMVARLEDSFSGEQALWDELNRIAEVVEAVSKKVDRIEPKLEGILRREGT